MLSHRKRRPLAPRTGSILPEQEPIYIHSYSQETETVSFQEGDQVVHKTMDYLNAGLPLKVLDVDRQQVLCSYIDDFTKAPVIAWYEKTDLKLVESSTETSDYSQDFI